MLVIYHKAIRGIRFCPLLVTIPRINNAVHNQSSADQLLDDWLLDSADEEELLLFDWLDPLDSLCELLLEELLLDDVEIELLDEVEILLELLLDDVDTLLEDDED